MLNHVSSIGYKLLTLKSFVTYMCYCGYCFASRRVSNFFDGYLFCYSISFVLKAL